VFLPAVLVALVASIALLLPSMSLASPQCASCSPWWHVLSVDEPTNLDTHQAANAVERLTVKAEKGQYVLFANEQEYLSQLTEVIYGKRTLAGMTAGAVLRFDATESEMQKALSGLYPERLLQVQEKPAGAHEHVYEIVFPGQAAPTVGTEVNGFYLFAGIERLELAGEEASVAVSLLQQGKPDGELVVSAQNRGDATVNGSLTPAEVVDSLPAGLRAVSITAGVPNSASFGEGGVPLACRLQSPAPPSPSRGSCRLEGTRVIFGGETRPKIVPPFDAITVHIGVIVEGAQSGAENRVSVSGGGAPAASGERPITIANGPASFGIEDYEMVNEEAGGAPDVQAGSHPFQTTFTQAINTSSLETIGEEGSERNVAQQSTLTKDLHFSLPAGWIGNPQAVARCPIGEFYTHSCPAETAVGATRTRAVDKGGSVDSTAPLYNVETSPGEAARFGFFVAEAVPIFIDATVRSGGDYGVSAHVENIIQADAFLSSEVTFWGVPGDPRHDGQRGEACMLEAREGQAACQSSDNTRPSAFLSLPTACLGLAHSVMEADSWQEPYSSVLFSDPMPALDGCNRLPFEPSIRSSVDVSEASKPSGLTVDVHLPQQASLSAGGLAVADPRSITVALPPGVAINPATADGLLACSEQLVGFQPGASGVFDTEPGVHNRVFTPYLPGDVGARDAISEGRLSASEGVFEPGLNFCANASRIAEVTIRTPNLPNPLKGFVYLAEQERNPFESLVAIYLVAEEEEAGVLVKLPGEVRLCETVGEVIDGISCQATGQIITTIKNSPQAPFEDAELHFFGGERAPLVTPARCGAYTASGALVPWSALQGSEGAASVPVSSTFNIESGPDGSPCPGASLPFNPSLTAGTTSIQAGGFTPFTMTVSREDGQQSIKTFQLHMPPGLSGLLTGVKLCGETEANTGTCGPESLIGETTVSVGLGGDPFSVKGGRVYITGPYEGAPFGVSVVVRAKAGPYDLGNVIVRGTIAVDPVTAVLTVTIDGSGAYKIPTILDGIPLQIKHINFTTTRPDFTFNPTNCDPLSVTGSMSSTEGATAPLSVPFQVTNCAILGFKPGFKVSTSGKTSRAKGASLSVKLTYPKTAFGSQANIKSVKVDLPKQLPSRLTTLQKACTAAQFQANPAGCPSASIVGHATAITPLIPVPLTGPAYFVSYGGAKFPELVIALQGYGVTLDVHGETFIDKAGITSSTFHTIPDAPVGSFELTLPQGKYSALAANGNLCKSKLKMPTAFTAQNGAVIKQSTPISVTGCARHKKKAKHARRARRAAHARHKHG
jgi:hypothetical protein